MSAACKIETCSACGATTRNQAVGSVSLKINRATVGLKDVQVRGCGECGHESLDDNSMTILTRIASYISSEEVRVCWICQTRPADTGEHKYKKSLAKAFYGSGSYRRINDPPLLIYSDIPDKHHPILGPDANRLKFGKSICGHCNSSVTQESDLAFDELLKFYVNNLTNMYTAKALDFEKCFPHQTDTKIMSLHKYFGKLMGCWISDAGYDVPLSLARYVSGDSDQHQLRCEFFYRPDLRAALGMRSRFMGFSGLCFYGNPVRFSQDFNIGWLMVRMTFSPESEVHSWRPSHHRLKLGRYSILTSTKLVTLSIVLALARVTQSIFRSEVSVKGGCT
jgi:hypothetical protein